MAIYRCNQCNHITEHAAESVGSTLKCPKCGHPNLVYDTTFFVKKVLEKFFALQASLKRIQAESESKEASLPTLPPNLSGIDLYNTDHFSSDLQHGPIHDWFAARKIQVKPNHKAVDTTGFYDEIAVELGKSLNLLGKIVDQIRHAQTREFTSININLTKHSQKEAQIITAFCRHLYDYSFVTKYFHLKAEKTIRLHLQSSPNIRSFFAGEWLEWFALMMLLEFSQEHQISFSGTRNLSVVFNNDDLHELDVFCLLNGNIPICIECKCGEFRQSIDKYLTLRKRLGLNKKQFIVCVSGLPDEQATGLSSMYELTFVNEQGLKSHLAALTLSGL
jgi:hypothetical protein